MFYRRKKYEFPKAGFRFTGVFQYLSHFGRHPTSFLLHRCGYKTAPYFSQAVKNAPLTVQEKRKSLDSRPLTFNEIISWLAGLERVTESDLRSCLLPLDLLLAALIDEINERALDLAGDIAFEESGEEFIIDRKALAAVVGTLE